MRVFGSIAYVHVPKEKRRKLDAKAKKCILVGYSNDQYQTSKRETRCCFDESASWYLPPTPDLNSDPSSDDEVNEAEMPPDEPEIKTREESPISFRLSGRNGRLSWYDQFDEESGSSGDSTVHSPRRKPRRQLTRKEKGKKKVSDSGTDRNELDQRESDSEGTGDGFSKAKSASIEMAST